MHGSEAAQFRSSLHCENESTAHRHESNHWECRNANLQHLANRCFPAVAVPHNGQGRAHRAEGRPQLSAQTSYVVEVVEGLSSDALG